MFSLHEGTTRIHRDTDGGVVINMDFESGAVHRVKFTLAEWCSAVTAVAELADTARTHEKVKAIHGAW